MIAAKENKLVIVERLLELGVNVNDRAKVSVTELVTYSIVRSQSIALSTRIFGIVSPNS